MNSTLGPRRALVVSFDQLPASILGCYGNEWIETPHLDRLAAAGVVADQCWSVRVGPQTGEEAFSTTIALSRAKRLSWQSLLIQEADAQVDFSAAPFDAVESLSGQSGPTAKPDQIPLAQLVRAAQRAWPSAQNAEQSSLCWIHARGLQIPAVPPAGFAELYQDEFEDRGVAFDTLSESDRQLHPSVAAGMMSLLDHWLGELLTPVANHEATVVPTLIVVTAAQGAAWQRLPNSWGPLDELRGQSAQPPLILQALYDARFSTAAGLRCQELLMTADVGPLLAWWFAESEASWRDWASQQSQAHAGRIITRGPRGAWRVSNADWGAIFPPNPDETTKPVLFHKPEDAWEVNNVAGLFPDIVASFQSA